MSSFGKIDDPFIKGLCIIVNTDAGPDLVANISPVNEANALITALHLVSLAGLEEDSQIDEDASKMIGPLPVKGSSEYRALYYSDMVKASNALDSRLIQFGAKVGIILFFDKDKLPEIRRAAGLIEPYLQRNLEKIEETNQLDRDFGLDLYGKIIDLVSKARVRTFAITEEGMKEYMDPGYVNAMDNVVILDELEKKLYLIGKKGVSPFSLRKMRQIVDQANSEFYRGAMQVVRLEAFAEIEPLLIKHGIQIT